MPRPFYWVTPDGLAEADQPLVQARPGQNGRVRRQRLEPRSGLRDAFTSAATLLGAGLNAGPGWWWADPAAALVIAVLAVREGLEAWEDEGEDEEEGAPDPG